ncbi:MAG: hypothetical protein IIZ93_12440 [Acidaminococcaceae bacterium]|nr:hypothetical protein [Acidaminococcaceae bacterium]
MSRKAWTEDGATITETLTPETIQKALDDMAQAILNQQAKKGEKQHGKELARNTAREV